MKVGSRFPLLGELQGILKQAVEDATVKAPLRHNAVEIFDEVNTGKIPVAAFRGSQDIIPDGDDAEIEVYMAGGGCTLPGRSKVLMPSEGYEGVVKFVLKISLRWRLTPAHRCWSASGSRLPLKLPPCCHVKRYYAQSALAILIRKRLSWSCVWKRASTVWGSAHKG